MAITLIIINIGRGQSTEKENVFTSGWTASRSIQLNPISELTKVGIVILKSTAKTCTMHNGICHVNWNDTLGVLFDL